MPRRPNQHGSGCHLESESIARALRILDPPPVSLLVVEKVGNLVCLALFDLGGHLRVVIVSVTEGEDKPLKYPHMFRSAQIVLLNKIDLLPHVPFDAERFVEYAGRVNPKLGLLGVSAIRGDGLAQRYAWLRGWLVRAPTGARV